MPLVDFNTLAEDLVTTWKSSIVGEVGPARIKVLRMDEQPYGEETHDYNEALLVIDGKLFLQVERETVIVEKGQMYIVPTGTPHAVLPGSGGTLVIIDV